MADIHYYVSKQRGNDSDSGTSPDQPWATLGKAAATVVAAAGGTGTFGNTVADGTAVGFLAPEKRVQRFTLDTSRAITKLSANIDCGGNPFNGKAIIYSDNAGNPDQLLAVSPEVTGSVNGVYDFSFSTPVTLDPGDYWWGLHLGATIIFVKGQTGSSSRTVCQTGDTYADGPSQTFTVSSSATDLAMALWATYSIAPSTTYINVGPGTYNEKVTIVNAGVAGAPIVWRADLAAAYVLGDKPGKVIITGRDAGGALTPGYVWNASGKTHVECRGFETDGSLDTYAFYGGSSPNSGKNYDSCRVTGGMSGIYGVIATSCVVANVKGTAFSAGGTTRSCIAMNCGTGFIGSTSNCLAIGCGVGFAGTTSQCVATGCSTGFSGSNVPFYQCLAVCCSYGYSTGYLYNCYEAGCASPNNPDYAATLFNRDTDLVSLSNWEAQSLGSLMLPAVGVPLAAKGLGSWKVFNSSFIAGNTGDLAVPRTINLNVPGAVPGTMTRALGVVLTTVPAAGTITVEFQENVATVWTTRRTVTKNASELTPNRMTVFEWPTALDINANGNTWRVLISGAGGAEAAGATAFLGLSSVNYWHFVTRPDDADFNGILLPSTPVTDLGPLILSDVTLDWSTYKTAAPGIRVTGYGYQIFQLPVAGGQPVTKRVWTKFADTGAQTITRDEFDRADGPIGNGWAEGADWSIVGGEAQAAWGYSSLIRPDVVADGYWEADMYLPVPSNPGWENQLGIWIRRDPAGDPNYWGDHGYTLWLCGLGSLSFVAGRGGTAEALWSYVLPSGAVNTTDKSVKVGVHAQGNTFDFYVNGAKVGSCTDTDPQARTTGNYGMVGWENENSRVKYFCVQDKPGGPMSNSVKPQIILRGLGATEQVVTAAAPETWEELTVSATPAVDGVMELVLLARDPSSSACSLFSA